MADTEFLQRLDKIIDGHVEAACKYHPHDVHTAEVHVMDQLQSIEDPDYRKAAVRRALERNVESLIRDYCKGR